MRREGAGVTQKEALIYGVRDPSTKLPKFVTKALIYMGPRRGTFTLRQIFARAKGNRTVFQIRIHGRGGQGVVTAAEILSVAAFDEGRHAQAFPSFGSERTGAPVVSFCRFDDRVIRTHEPVMEPDAVIIQDVTLIHQVDLFSGLSPDGYVLINTSNSFSDLGFGDFFDHYRIEHLMTCPATDIALEHLGRPLPNAALLGGFAALTGEITLDAIDKAVREHFTGPVGERNAAAVKAAFGYVASKMKEASRASTN